MLTTDIVPALTRAKESSTFLAELSDQKRTDVLLHLAEALIAKTADIMDANSRDLVKMKGDDPTYDRLMLTTERIAALAQDVQKVAAFPSPLQKVLEQRTLPNGLELSRVSTPIGVIGMIYEARPNVTVDAFSLCFKSGNAVVLRGGSDAQESNMMLVSIIHDVLRDAGIDDGIVALMPADRAAVDVMLKAHRWIDVVIPRGSQGLIDFVRQNAQLPVIETGAGIVHTFVDATASTAMAADIVFNAKTRRPSVCNSLDTLIIHEKKLKDLPAIVAPLQDQRVKLCVDEPSLAALHDSYDTSLMFPVAPEDYGTEFLSLKMSLKTVANLEQALEHIAKYSSQHTEVIISEDKKNIEQFLKRVDAACVFVNASSSFSDGGEFGLGAEVGISTQKIHARGPMGMEALTTYKWILRGKGQTRS